MLKSVVAIGASAGGLKPVTNLLASLESLSDTALIVAQHSSPKHESLLPQLLGKSTKTPVEMAMDGAALLPGRIYIVPPGYHCEVVRSHILLTTDIQIGPRPSIDRLFDSLAIHEGFLVVGIVLSGTGTDGTRGLLSIKSQGGITIAQLPQSAEYDSMPTSAINQSAADIILAPEDIGAAVNTIVNRLYRESDYKNDSASSLFRILELIQKKTRIDLFNYKPSTLQRRILRRANLSHVASIDDYFTLLTNDDDELSALVNDIFISITSFKRDPRLWASLESVLADYISSGPRNIRIWSAGCSTGEEPYSIAILLEQIKQRHQLDFEYQILATDISEKVIAQARSGIYDGEVLTNLSLEENARFFGSVNNAYQVNKSIRDRVIFSVHNVLVDPPFSRIDLVFCRNLLIYFNSILQERALRSFGYSLKPHSVLVLGMSETISSQRKLFEDISSELKIYRRNNIPVSFQMDSYAPPTLYHLEPRKSERRNLDYLSEINLALGAANKAESMLINSEDDIIFKHGRCEPLMVLAEGKFSSSFFVNINPRFRASLRAMCFKARRTSSQISFQEALEENSSLLAVQVTPSPLHEGWLVITQEVREPPKSELQRLHHADLNSTENDRRLIEELEGELNATRESLQTVVEELETTNEELQSTNEELQSSNEELQATNEELQTTNEELQSSNEELHTVNDELSTKNDQLQHLSADLMALEESLEVPYLLIGMNGRVSKYSRYISELVDDTSLHVNDLFKGVVWHTQTREEEALIVESVRASLEEGKTFLHLVTFRNDKVYNVDIRPYQKKDRAGSLGCLLVLNDVSREFRQVLQQTIEKDKAYELLNTLNTGVVLTDNNGIITFFTRCAQALLELPANAVGQFFDKTIRLFSHARQEHPEVGIFQSLTDNFHEGEFASFDRRLLRRNGSELIYLDASAKPIAPTGHNEPGWLISVANVTSIISLNEKLQWAAYHDTLTQLANRRYLSEFIEQGLQQRSTLGSFIYAIIDLDHFKPINDTFGHKAGDGVLARIAATMQGALRKTDLLARIGGDEFSLVLPHTSHDNGAFILDKLVKAVAELRFTFGEKIMNSTLSIGWVTVSEEEFITPMELYQRADTGVYEAKRLGGNRHCRVFGQDKNEGRHVLMLEEIKQGIRHKSFELCFQPIRSLRQAGCRYRFEVLLRLRHTDGLLLPNRFLAVAERYRLMPQIDRYVIEHVLQMAREHGLFHHCGLSLSINISTQTLQDRSLIDFIEGIPLDLPLGCLIFEITESAAVENIDNVRQFIDFAHSKGIKVALDDFGTSYNSFHLLKKLDLDFVKIDGCFINTIMTDANDQAFLEALLKISKLRNFGIVAEWIDTEDKLHFMCDKGVDYVQGYHIHTGYSEEELLARFKDMRDEDGAISVIRCETPTLQ